MKKLVVLLACGLTLLSGCSSASAKITNGSETIVSMDGKNYTRQDLYSFMANYSGSYFAVSNAQKTILDTEVAVTDEMNTNVDSNLSMYETMLGDSFEPYIQSMGYPSVEAYRETLIQNEQLNQLYKNYVSENYDTLAAKYMPKQIQMMKFDSEEAAKAALDAVNGGQDFANVAQEKSSSVDGAAQIVTNQTSNETVVQYTINELPVGTVSEVVANDDGSAFYIVKVLQNDAAAMKEEAIPVIAGISSISTEATQYFFKKYNFKIYDIDLFNQVKESYADLINQ